MKKGDCFLNFRKNSNKFVLLLLILLTFCSCREKENQDAACERIVSTAPSLTETLFELGLGDRVVGVTENSHFPSEVEKITKIGKVLDINSEILLSLKPDTVFVLSVNEALATKVASLGVKVVSVNQSTLSGFRESVVTISKVCKSEEKGRALTRKIDDFLQGYQKSEPPTTPLPRVMVVVGHDYLSRQIKDVYVAGNDGFFSKIIELSGAKNVAETKLAYSKIQLEGVISMNPDIVIDIVDNSNLSRERIDFIAKSWSLLPINAAKNKMIYIENDDFWTIPGPRFFKIFEEMQKILKLSKEVASLQKLH